MVVFRSIIQVYVPAAEIVRNNSLFKKFILINENYFQNLEQCIHRDSKIIPALHLLLITINVEFNLINGVG